MKKRRLVFSDSAAADIVEQADWYAGRSGAGLAHRWEEAVTAAVLRVMRRPALGTRCCRFRAADLENVRQVAISGFPKHLLFYRLEETQILILRVIHGARDLERLL